MNQKDQILKHLKSGKSLTKLEAIREFGIINLGGRISELRSKHPIQTTMIERNGKTFAQYSLGDG